MSTVCLCKQPSSTRETQPMIGCDGECKDWYHYGCVGLTVSAVDNMSDNEVWLCPLCISKKENINVTNTPNEITNEEINKVSSKIERMDLDEKTEEKSEEIKPFKKPKNKNKNKSKSKNKTKNKNKNKSVKKSKKKNSAKKKLKKLKSSQKKEEKKEEKKVSKKALEEEKTVKTAKTPKTEKKEEKKEEKKDIKKKKYTKDSGGESVVYDWNNIRHLLPVGFIRDIIDPEELNKYKEYCNKQKETLEYECIIKNKERNSNPELKDKEQKMLERCFANTWSCPINSCPIRCDVTTFDFNKLIKYQLKYNNNKLFSCIMMDPPWQLASSNPTRGVALGYKQLDDSFIMKIPVAQLQKDGFIFIWVINAKYRFAMELLQKWGYKIVGDIAWVKSTVNFRISRGHGYYLQHGKETCFIGIKGTPDLTQFRLNNCSDAIFSLRRGQSQKPTEIYQFIEHFAPPKFGHTYLEIFGRRNNLRNGWVTLGNEL